MFQLIGSKFSNTSHGRLSARKALIRADVAAQLAMRERDEIIRRAYEAGLSGLQITECLTIGKSRVYQILEEQDEGERKVVLPPMAERLRLVRELYGDPLA
jgi:hypothetical protein